MPWTAGGCTSCPSRDIKGCSRDFSCKLPACCSPAEVQSDAAGGLAWWDIPTAQPSPQTRPQPCQAEGSGTQLHSASSMQTRFYYRKPWPAETGHKPFHPCAHRVSVNASDLSTHGKTSSLQSPTFPEGLWDMAGIVAAQSQPSTAELTWGAQSGPACPVHRGKQCKAFGFLLYHYQSLIHLTCTWAYYPNLVCLPWLRLQQHPQGQICHLAPVETQMQTTSMRNGPGSNCRMQKLQLQQENQCSINSRGEHGLYL